MSTFHANAEAAFDAVATPATLADVNDAQLAVMAIWRDRGSYGCEHHVYVDAMRRVSAILFQPGCLSPLVV